LGNLLPAAVDQADVVARPAVDAQLVFIIFAVIFADSLRFAVNMFGPFAIFM
jgi:hypothetical protein